MKKRSTVVCSLSLVMLLVVFAFYRDSLFPAKMPDSTEFALVFNQAMAEEKAHPRPKITPSAEDQAVIEQLKSAKTQEEEQRILKGASQFVKRLFVFANAGMDYFDFYGRVIDQFDAPVPGVEIVTYVGGGHLGGGSGFAHAITDNEGYFVIKDKKGGSLQIREMVKRGYEIDFKKQVSGFIFTLTEHEKKQSYDHLWCFGLT